MLDFKIDFSYEGKKEKSLDDVIGSISKGDCIVLCGESGCGDSDIMMTDTINPLKSKFKGFHKTFKQDDLGLSLSSFLLN
ncbi:ATP-binding protein [Tissierellia bacterium S7-1-4]|nr:ATP-binding protein [Tissierellia bacterium S7-1-4]